MTLNEERSERVSDIPDLREVSVAGLRDLPESAIGDALRRILAELDSDVEPVAGFQSGI